jgi:ferredoxin-NADP reductase
MGCVAERLRISWRMIISNIGVVKSFADDLNLQDVDAYLCGPPPMVDAAIALLIARGVPEAHIYYDKFTTTADTEETSRT